MNIIEQRGEHQKEREQRDALEGIERIALLPLARHVALVPGATAHEPPYVFIEWAPGAIERPYPGTAIWRAVLSRYLAEQGTSHPFVPPSEPWSPSRSKDSPRWMHGFFGRTTNGRLPLTQGIPRPMSTSMYPSHGGHGSDSSVVSFRSAGLANARG